MKNDLGDESSTNMLEVTEYNIYTKLKERYLNIKKLFFISAVCLPGLCRLTDISEVEINLFLLFFWNSMLVCNFVAKAYRVYIFFLMFCDQK